MEAYLLFHKRIEYNDGAIVEMVLRRAPSPVPESMYGLEYSLFYGRPGIREVSYDNERGKGDHRHFQGVETTYAFNTVEKLMADFRVDVRGLRGTK
jgi:hypothetical protein